MSNVYAEFNKFLNGYNQLSDFRATIEKISYQFVKPAAERFKIEIKIICHKGLSNYQNELLYLDNLRNYVVQFVKYGELDISRKFISLEEDNIKHVWTAKITGIIENEYPRNN